MAVEGIDLVTGASGFVGSHLVDELLAAGRRVRAMVRRSSDLMFVHPDAEVVTGDVTRPASLPSVVAGVRRVYHVAGVVSTRRLRSFHEVNAVGARSLLRVCRSHAPECERFVFVSSIAALGPSPGGRPLREDDPPRPVSRYGWSKLRAERWLAEEAGELPLTVVRPPVVFGPRDRNVILFFNLLARGWRPRFPREKYYSLIHVRDLARGIRMAGEAEAGAGRTVHLAAPRAWSMRAVLAKAAVILGVLPRPLPVSEPLLPLLAGISDALAPAFGLSVPPARDKIREMLADFWIADTTRARRELGFAARIPLGDGLRETIDFARERGWILPGKTLVC